MFANRTVLLLRAMSRPAPLLPDWFSFRRSCHLARTVMEAKQHLLQCVRSPRLKRLPIPALIMVDAGLSNADIKSELELWIERHPRLRRVQVVCTPASSWLKRIWKRGQ